MKYEQPMLTAVANASSLILGGNNDVPDSAVEDPGTQYPPGAAVGLDD
jgi:hypothetical protein